MEEKKKGKGVKVFLVIFIILFVLAAGALGYGYTKYKDLKNENTNLNTKYEEINNQLNNANKNLEENSNKVEETANTTKEEYHNYVSGYDFSIYAIGYYESVIAYKGKMYLVDVGDVFADGSSNVIVSTTMIKKGLKAGKYGFGYKVKTTEEDGESYTELNWKACSKKDDSYCDNYVMDLGISESEVNRVVIQGAPGATDARQYPMIVKKDGSVYRVLYEGYRHEVEKIDLEHKNVDNIRVTCDGKAETCKNYTYELTLKDGTTVTETKSVR